MKCCSVCGLPKDDSEFYARYLFCKKCVLSRQKEKYHTDPDFRSRVIKASVAYLRAHPEKYKDRALKQRHGLTRQQYDMMLESQEGVCAICGQPETKKFNGKVCRLHVDHDHATNEIRGLLCGKCNVALGAFNDDISVMIKAIQYLQESRRVSHGQQIKSGGQVHH